MLVALSTKGLLQEFCTSSEKEIPVAFAIEAFLHF